MARLLITLFIAAACVGTGLAIASAQGPEPKKQEKRNVNPNPATTPPTPPKPYWKKRGCSHGHPSRVSYRVTTRILKNQTPVTVRDKRRIRHYINCVASSAKRRAVTRHVNRLFRWRDRYVCTGRGNVALGKCMAAKRGWVGGQWNCLYALWRNESNWNHRVPNRQGSGAYGIPQALPGYKMGPGWQHDPEVQIRWGLGYIAGRYGTPCGALAFWQAQSPHWY